MERYIGVEDVVKTIAGMCIDADGEVIDIVEIFEEIEHLPPADVEEIKHGHWYGVSHYQDKASGQCSECKKRGVLRTSRDDWGLWYIDMTRCPNCGAIMDGKINYI